MDVGRTKADTGDYSGIQPSTFKKCSTEHGHRSITVQGTGLYTDMLKFYYSGTL
jgi:hypothetical protein